MGEIIQLVLVVLSFAALVLVASLRPIRPKLSQFELRRRASGGKHAKLDLRRSQQVDSVELLLRIMAAVILVGLVLLAVGTFGWAKGTILSFLVALIYLFLSRMSFIQSIGQSLYGRLEVKLLNLAERTAPILRQKANDSAEQNLVEFSSRQELAHMVSSSKGIINDKEKNLLISGLEFDSKLVSDVMVPRAQIKTVESSELLGPLTLDDLHKTGHRYLPVVEGSKDRIVGLLPLEELLVATSKKTLTAQQAMDEKLFYVRKDQALYQALAAFLETRQHLFIVIDGKQKIVGLITLKDVVEALFGSKITDELDYHNNPGAVAKRDLKQ